MKSVYKFIAVPALLSALGATSFAQSARRTVINIPFDFVVGQKTLHAGKAAGPETVTLAVAAQK